MTKFKSDLVHKLCRNMPSLFEVRDNKLYLKYDRADVRVANGKATVSYYLNDTVLLVDVIESYQDGFAISIASGTVRAL